MLISNLPQHCNEAYLDVTWNTGYSSRPNNGKMLYGEHQKIIHIEECKDALVH